MVSSHGIATQQSKSHPGVDVFHSPKTWINLSICDFSSLYTNINLLASPAVMPLPSISRRWYAKLFPARLSVAPSIESFEGECFAPCRDLLEVTIVPVSRLKIIRPELFISALRFAHFIFLDQLQSYAKRALVSVHHRHPWVFRRAFGLSGARVSLAVAHCYHWYSNPSRSFKRLNADYFQDVSG
jgi:hypothetical protein